MHLLHSSELEAVRQYFKEALSTNNQYGELSYIIEENAAEKITIQQDSCSCGVYCVMIADCLTSNVDITLLTPSAIIKDRQRIAQNLISQHAPFLVTSHVTTTTEYLNQYALPKFLQKGTALHALKTESLSTSDQHLASPTVTYSSGLVKLIRRLCRSDSVNVGNARYGSDVENDSILSVCNAIPFCINFGRAY